MQCQERSGDDLLNIYGGFIFSPCHQVRRCFIVGCQTDVEKERAWQRHNPWVPQWHSKKTRMCSFISKAPLRINTLIFSPHPIPSISKRESGVLVQAFLNRVSFFVCPLWNLSMRAMFMRPWLFYRIGQCRLKCNKVTLCLTFLSWRVLYGKRQSHMMERQCKFCSIGFFFQLGNLYILKFNV